MTSDPDFGEITAWAFALLTMRVDTPGGEWLADDYQRVYAQGWGELQAQFGVDTASEMAILDLANLAMHLVDYLVAVTGQPAATWLQQLRRDYVEGETDRDD